MVSVQARRPLDAKKILIPRGQLFIIPERCKGCKFCIDFCPRDVLEETSAMNAKGYHYPVVVEGKEEECIACQFCSVICPEFAIYAEEIAE
jgi:2-oxoglutarate ferredoxin oxidoreductase subunit delta